MSHKKDTYHDNSIWRKKLPFLGTTFYFICRERSLICVGIFAAVAGGCSMPVMIILFGQLANSFVSQETCLTPLIIAQRDQRRKSGQSSLQNITNGVE
jgi:hypothetical protein